MTFTRQLVSGTTQLTLSSGVVRLLSIVTMPILTSLLSPQAYGMAALVGTVISLVSVFALAGIDVSYIRAYRSTQPPSGADVEHYCWRFAISAALLTAVCGAIGWWFMNRDSVELDHHLSMVLALGIVFSVVHTMAQTRARLEGRYRAMSLAIIAAGIASPAVSIGIAAWWRQDALALLLPMLLGYLIPVLLLGSPPISGLAKSSDLTRNEAWALIKIGLPAVVTAPMYWLLSSSDRWFLQHYQGAEAVGVYSIGYSVAIIGMMVNTAVMSVWLPEAAREYEEDRARAQVSLGRLMSRLVAAMAIIWLAATAAGGDIIRWLANERFHASADYVPYIAGGVFFYGASQLALSGLVLANQFKWAALWWIAGGVVSTALNLALVPTHGGTGAAVTQSASFAFIAFGILASSQAKFHLHLDWRRLAATMAIVIAAGAFLSPPWHGSSPLSLLMKLPAGIGVAALVGWLVAPDWYGRGMQHLRSKYMT